MREALNQNPVVQAVLIGILLLAAAVLVLGQMGGGASSSSPSPAAAPGTAPGASLPAATPSTPATAAPPGTTAVVPAGAPAPFEAGPGLPRTLVAAHAEGKTIVLLVAKRGGLEDAPVRAAVEGLKGDTGLSVHITDTKGAARYAGVMQGVGVSRVPALVVVGPGGQGEPRASVSYGFRDAAGVRQAVRDAVYRGVTRGYDPG